MRPLIFDLLFKDDRMFVLEISRSTTSSMTSDVLEKKEWSVVTRRNVPGYLPRSINSFATRAEAVEYYKSVVVETPRVSLGSESPSPSPSLDEYTAWLLAEKLFDPVLNPDGNRNSDS